MTTHVVVGENVDKNGIMEVKQGINNIIKQLSLEHTTIEIEYEEENCRLKNC